MLQSDPKLSPEWRPSIEMPPGALSPNAREAPLAPPLIYAIFVRDLSSSPPEGIRCLMFSDLYAHQIRGVVSHLKKAATAIADWCARIRMALPTPKCVVLQHDRVDLSYHIDGVIVSSLFFPLFFHARSCKTLFPSIFRCFITQPDSQNVTGILRPISG